MALTLPDIELLFARRGAEEYSGEPVTQLEHALLAEQSGADDELVTAALLHDLGHLLNDHGTSPTLRGIDDVHQYVALPFLRGVFGERVLGAIQRHVDAKRYLRHARGLLGAAFGRLETKPRTAGRHLRAGASAAFHQRCWRS